MTTKNKQLPLLIFASVLIFGSCNNIGWVKRNITHYYGQDYITNNDSLIKLDTAGLYYPLFNDSINLIWPGPMAFGADGLIRTQSWAVSCDASGPYYIKGDTLIFQVFALVGGWPGRKFMQKWTINDLRYLIKGDTLMLYSRHLPEYPEYDYINDSPEKHVKALRYVFLKCNGPFYFYSKRDIRWQPWIWMEKKQWKEWKKQQKQREASSRK